MEGGMERTIVCFSFILSHLSTALGASAARFGRNSVRYKIAVQRNAIFGFFFLTRQVELAGQLYNSVASLTLSGNNDNPRS